MDIKSTETILKRINEDIELVKRMMRNEKDNGRSLFYKENYEGIATMMLQAGSDLATAESDWWELRDRQMKKKINHSVC